MPTPTRRIARRLTALGLAVGLAAVLVSTAIASGADGSWDLSKPGLPSSANPLVGFAAQGVALDVLADTPVSAFGIRAGIGSATTLTAEVRDITGMPAGTAPGAPVIASGSTAVDASAVDWHDVPVSTTLLAGHRYDVRFQITGGWGFEANPVDQQSFDNHAFDASVPFAPEDGGPFLVVDGGGGFDASYTYTWTTLPHVHVIGAALDARSPDIDVAVAAGDEQAPTGWYNAASSGTDGVTVEVTATDASALKYVRCTDRGATVLDTTSAVSAIQLGEGIHSIACVAEDVHGNRGSTDAATSVRVDQLPPTLTPVVNPNPVREGQFAEAFPKASDDFSVTDATCDPVATKQVGRHSVTCRAEDAAGNEATAEADYDVQYAFDGFFSPVRMNETNRAKAGSSVPLKFSIGEYDGLDILAGGSPSVQLCGGGSVTHADGRLSYDADAGEYVYVWKTDRTWSGTCREITVRLDDGSAKSVSFLMT